MWRLLKAFLWAVCGALGWCWHLLDVIGRGEVAMHLDGWLKPIQEFVLAHQEIGYRIAPWFLMVVALSGLVLMQWPLLLTTHGRPRRAAPVTEPRYGAQLAGMAEEMLPLREAVGIAMAATRNTTTAAFNSGQDEGASVYSYFVVFLDNKTPIYGKTPPANDWVLLDRFEPSEETLWEMKSIKPHHKPVRITDLSVSRDDLYRAIQAIHAGDSHNLSTTISMPEAAKIAHEEMIGLDHVGAFAAATAINGADKDDAAANSVATHIARSNFITSLFGKRPFSDVKENFLFNGEFRKGGSECWANSAKSYAYRDIEIDRAEFSVYLASLKSGLKSATHI